MTKYLILTLLSLSLVFSHLCIYSPQQRGGWDVATSVPGDQKCFQPKGPCGSFEPGKPVIQVFGGSSIAVSFQQNLNHYNPGWPGLLDVSYAPGSSPQESDFHVVGVVSDYWPHLQATQTNFTVVVNLPNVDCPSCVLRVRYRPNKPTEPVFHNCADFSITKSSYPSKKLFAFEQYHRNYGVLNMVGIEYSGNLVSYGDINLRGEKDDETYVANGLVSTADKDLWFIGDKISTFLDGKAPRSLYRFNVEQKSLSLVSTFPTNELASTSQLSAIIATGDPTSPLIAIEQFNGKNYQYGYSVKRINSNGSLGTAIASTEAESTYVNYFWSTYDSKRNLTYILSGDENSLKELNVVLHTVNMVTGAVNTVNVQNDAYTLATIHVDTQTGTLYGISPGLFGQNNWAIVKIDPSGGNVTLSTQIKSSDAYKFSFGGGVYNGLTGGSAVQITHMFQKSIDNSYELAVINANTGVITYKTAVNTNNNENASFQSIVQSL